MYYLIIKCKRHDAKRHIAGRHSTIEECERDAKYINKVYIIEIYDGKWNLIKSVTNEGE